MSYTFLYSLAAFLIVLFLSFRFGFFSKNHQGGRMPLFFGLSILLLAVLWQALKLTPDYNSWFIPGAYSILDIIQLLIFFIASVLLAVGFAFYADNWESKREELESREGKLSVLENLQHDARQPYPMLELLNIALKEILVHYPLAAGAILLVNRSKRQFVLTSSSGFTRDETATLEYYPIGRNVITQSVELGDPSVFSKLDLYDRSGEPVKSRFSSGLIMPLNSGMDKLGGLLLLSEETKFFDRTDIRTLIPVAQWLSEKVKSARAARETAQLQREVDRTTDNLQDIINRFSGLVTAIDNPEPLATFSKSLVGLGQAESVHIIGFEKDEVSVLAGSKPLLELSENYRTALTDAISRTKPIIINQEATDSNDQEQSQAVLLSSLVSPTLNPLHKQAILLRKSGSSFSFNDNELKLLELMTGLLPIVSNSNDVSYQGSFQRKGFDSILNLLQGPEITEDFKINQHYLINQIISVLPDSSLGLVFIPTKSDKLKLVHLSSSVDESLPNIDINNDLGIIGRVATNLKPEVITDKADLFREISIFSSTNNIEFSKTIEKERSASFMIAVPIIVGDEFEGVISFTIRGTTEDSASEWQRFIVLAVELYSLRLTINQLSKLPINIVQGEIVKPGMQSVANDLNNHLSAIIGQTELVIQKTDLALEELNLLNQVMEESEKAADCVKQLTENSKIKPSIERSEIENLAIKRDISQIITETLSRSHVSGDIYMAGQRPREINKKIENVGNLIFADDEIRMLFESVLDRFATTASDEDIITIALYKCENYAYLDISRHRRNFPPVEAVSGFGQYENTKIAFENRPGDIYLRHLTSSMSYYAIDKSSANPAYLSFRFPLASVKDEIDQRENSGSIHRSDKPIIRLLAIDDQPVILDLISAMGQSLGYHIITAQTGEEGLKLAQERQIDILLTDLALPGISGLEVARRFQLIQPDKPVILVTGWDAGLKDDELSATGITKVLYKPFRIEQLTEVVQSVISQSVS